MNNRILKKALQPLTMLVLSCISLTANAQSPEIINYQAVCRDNNGDIIANQSLNFRFSVRQNSGSGTILYQEIQQATSNIFGLVNLEIGAGTVQTGNFHDIQWGNGSKFFQVEMDAGSGYQNLGISQLLSVPYAFHANTADSLSVPFTELDPVFIASAAHGIDAALIGNWNTAFGWGNHAAAGYLTSFTESDPVFSASAASGINTAQITNWNSAYGWGNHATAGYLTSFTETDPIFSASASSGINTAQITNWNSAYGWGNHATAGYLTSFTETDPIFSASPASGINSTNISNWNTAFGWGNHATAGYLTSFTELDPKVGTNTLNYLSKWNGTALVSSSIFDNGNVGIGTASPSNKLEVTGNIKINSTAGNVLNVNALVIENSGGADFVTIRNNGSSGSAELRIDNNNSLGSKYAILTYQMNGNDKWTCGLDVGGNGNYGYSIVEGTQMLSNARFYISPGGNIGIGNTTPAVKLDVSGVIASTGGNSTNWNTAYGWGNHASAGYLTSFTENDPVFNAAPASGISSTNITNWNSAYGWGNHATAGYLTSFTELDPKVGTNTLNYLSKWNGSALVTSSVYDNGNVGISNPSPSYPLDVIGYTRSSTGFISNNVSPYSSASAILSVGGDVPGSGGSFNGVKIYTSQPFGNSEAGYIQIDAPNAANSGNITIKTATVQFTTPGNVVVDVARTYGTGNIQLLGGNVGIGTSSPATVLDVNGVVTASGGNSNNWNTAYSWGNHASAGYQSLIHEVADEFSATAGQTAFTLSQTPGAQSKVKMYINGIRISNSAYTWTGTGLTYNPASNGSYSLTAGDRVQFDYFY